MKKKLATQLETGDVLSNGDVVVRVEPWRDPTRVKVWWMRDGRLFGDQDNGIVDKTREFEVE